MKRSDLREHIFRLLFISAFQDAQEMPDQFRLYFEEQEGIGEQDEAYIREKAHKIVEKTPEIDALLNSRTKGWKTERMNKVDLTILRLALYEMKYDEDVPERVAIDEAVELSKKYSGDEGPSFVNGVLAKFA